MDDIYFHILGFLDINDLMDCRSVRKEWAHIAEQIIRITYEKKVSCLLNACRFKCNKVPLKWLIRYHMNQNHPVIYKCAYCGGPTYEIGECKNKHWRKNEIRKKIFFGPSLSLFIILSMIILFSEKKLNMSSIRSKLLK